MKYHRATRVLINNAYNKIEIAVGDPAPEERLLLAVIKQSMFDAYMWAPRVYAASGKRFLFGDGMACACLDLHIDFDFTQRILVELATSLDNPVKMQRLDEGLKKLTARKRTDAAATSLCKEYGNGP